MAELPVQDGLLQVFDVEHGACSLLTIPMQGGNCMRMLIDCGHNATTKWYPGEHLRNLGITRIDQLVITNYDEDHVSGYPNLLQQGVCFDWILRNPTVAPRSSANSRARRAWGQALMRL